MNIWKQAEWRRWVAVRRYHIALLAWRLEVRFKLSNNLKPTFFSFSLDQIVGCLAVVSDVQFCKVFLCLNYLAPFQTFEKFRPPSRSSDGPGDSSRNGSFGDCSSTSCCIAKNQRRYNCRRTCGRRWEDFRIAYILLTKARNIRRRQRFRKFAWERRIWNQSDTQADMQTHGRKSERNCAMLS